MENGAFEGIRLEQLKDALKNDNSIVIEGLWNSTKALVLSLAQKVTGKNILILTGASVEELRLFNDFPYFFERTIIDFPAWETLPSEKIAPSPDVVGERYTALKNLLNAHGSTIILSSVQAILQKLIPPSKFSTSYLSLQTGQTHSFETLVKKLQEMGYQKKSVASDKGEMALRGGIIDIFPVSSPDPFRIEFWGDEIESIRTFDPIGQKSIQVCKECDITAALELELINQEEQLANILDYLGPQTIVVFDDLLAIEDRYTSLINILGQAPRTFLSFENFLDRCAPLQKIYLSHEAIDELSEVRVKNSSQNQHYYSNQSPLYTLTFQMFGKELEAERWNHPFIPISSFLVPEETDSQVITGQDLLNNLSRLTNSNFQTIFLSTHETEQQQFKKRIEEASYQLPNNTTFQIGYLSSGFVNPDSELIIFPYTEITKRYKLRRQKQRSTYHAPVVEMYDLHPGDIVVHSNNGIAKYLGIEKKPNHLGNESEFFSLEYADQAKLYVPLNQAHLVSKYIGASEEIPKLNSLGNTKWKKTKELTEKAILGYASQLLDLYAKRSLKPGYVYPEDSFDVKSFEEEFPFVETEDQLEAVRNIKQDMQSAKNMDRLVCGDVGYGKTEVAMRAAFKAVVDGHKQVAILVPTTVLAMQHYENFCDRMANFPIRIGVLSRFRTSKQTKETLKELAEGSLDIIIGTHRLIGSDVVFKDLGLIIIDEEQRFGVKAKEHLKQVKIGVDCLTLSATPIPRTLYMSLIGARDMSVISTPPQDRLPITTLLTDSNEQTIKTALLRELARDGQAYFIHNRVETIFEVADKLKKMLPQAKIVVAHGQMSSNEIDLAFHSFKNGQANILVATTIVESGIDIPNANTILIDRADTFGLADLYQLRGRVGRWIRKAYAYFLVKNLRSLSEMARKRLNALIGTSGYGGGMKIAMRDLEIRGAGNIIGTEQSGHVSEVGYHLYCKWLKRAILALEGKIPSTLVDTKLEFPSIDYGIPEKYINESNLRKEIYHRLGEAIEPEEIDTIWSELQDRFGTPPLQTKWLYHLSKVKVHASRHGFLLLRQDKLSLTMEKKKGGDVQTKKILLKPFKTPQELEDKLMQAMKSF
ncbi:MAG: transcription-repair coupling factor [Chlamydia sp. 32-24]|nr:MAG: transcription-repair coupling factor [Chlamydia sp. 32-24]